jgi:hypothetical protein
MLVIAGSQIWNACKWKNMYSYLLKNMGRHKQLWLASPHMWLPDMGYICIKIPLNKPANWWHNEYNDSQAANTYGSISF